MGKLALKYSHRLLCGDSASIADVERLMGGEKADMVFTDPPYNIASDASDFMTGTSVSKALKDLKDADWDKNFNIEAALTTLLTAVKESFTAYIWTSQFLINRIWDFFKEHDYTYYLVWAKKNPMPSLSEKHPTFNTELCAYIANGKQRTVNFPEKGHFLSCRDLAQSTHGRLHPTQKPIELIEPILEFSSNPQQIVLDLFGGSGSTLIACEKTNRKCYMCELQPRYIDVIIKRYEDFTGNKATLVKDN